MWWNFFLSLAFNHSNLSAPKLRVFRFKKFVYITRGILSWGNLIYTNCYIDFSVCTVFTGFFSLVGQQLALFDSKFLEVIYVPMTYTDVIRVTLNSSFTLSELAFQWYDGQKRMIPLLKAGFFGLFHRFSLKSRWSKLFLNSRISRKTQAIQSLNSKIRQIQANIREKHTIFATVPPLSTTDPCSCCCCSGHQMALHARNARNAS